MPGGGDLFLQTKNVILDEADVEAYNLAPGKYVCVSVSDSGIGLDDGILERIFDPFFIAEDMGWKLGLGVSSAEGIIRNHGALLEIESIIMEGATYNLYLPIVRARQEPGDERNRYF
jgi:two-component system cell cycle sensor histidine kinase/response regulator CckA